MADSTVLAAGFDVVRFQRPVQLVETARRLAGRRQFVTQSLERRH